MTNDKLEYYFRRKKKHKSVIVLCLMCIQIKSYSLFHGLYFGDG